MQNIEQQPFYVLAGVCIDANKYAAACDDIRTKVARLNLPGLEFPLGQGSEIKARELANRSGWWRNNERERTRVRDLMLGFPAEYGGTAFDSMLLIREGSQIIYFSRFSGERKQTTLPLDRILEMSLGDSKNSIGLQIADFFCRCTYLHFKNGRPY
jgi:hypothetical protein